MHRNAVKPNRTKGAEMRAIGRAAVPRPVAEWELRARSATAVAGDATLGAFWRTAPLTGVEPLISVTAREIAPLRNGRMARREGKSSWPLASAAWLIASALSGCGTVLPPLEDASDEAGTIDDGGTGDDAFDEDADFPPDDDAGETGTAVDAALDVADGCRTCTDARSDGDAPNDTRSDARASDTSADLRADGDGASCPTPVDCALAACNGVSCGAHGLVCKSSACACPGGQTKETTCGDGTDNDCDGLVDCADSDCAKLQCGASTNQRCCGTTCVNTETDPANCQGCGLACASGQTCKRVVDDAGTRGACTCAGLTTQCPRNPSQICRAGNNDGEDNLCACDLAGTGNAGCADGQVCVDVPGANYCRY